MCAGASWWVSWVWPLDVPEDFLLHSATLYLFQFMSCYQIYCIIASAGRHQTCLPSWRKESSARVYARYVSSEILWGSKDKNFLGHFWLGIFIQDNLWTSSRRSNLFLICCQQWNEKNNQFSRSKFYIQRYVGCCFCKDKQC